MSVPLTPSQRRGSFDDVIVEIRPDLMVRESIDAKTPVDLENRMNQVIKIAELTRKTIARGILARGGQFDFDVTAEKKVIEEQIFCLKQIRKKADDWLGELHSSTRDKKSWCLNSLEWVSAITTTAVSVIDIVTEGNPVASIVSGVSSGVQGVSSLGNKYLESSMAEREEEIGRLLFVKKRSIRMITDLTEAIFEYNLDLLIREGSPERSEAAMERALRRSRHHRGVSLEALASSTIDAAGGGRGLIFETHIYEGKILKEVQRDKIKEEAGSLRHPSPLSASEKGMTVTPQELWAGRLCYLMRVKKRKIREVSSEDEVRTIGSSSKSSFPRDILPIPEIPYIGPTLDDWGEAIQEAVGAGRAIRKAALSDKRKGVDEEKGYETTAFELYRQIRVLDYVIGEIEKVYQKPQPVCGVSKKKFIFSSTAISENIAWLVGWGALASVFIQGYSVGVVALKLAATVGQGGASYWNSLVTKSMVEQVKRASQLKNLIEEAKRERESFYLTLLSYYPHFDEDEEVAMTLKGRVVRLESKLDKLLKASPEEVSENPDHIALKLLMRERDAGVHIQQLQFSASIPGYIFSHMRDYVIRFPARSLSELLVGTDSGSSCGSRDDEEPPREMVALGGVQERK